MAECDNCGKKIAFLQQTYEYEDEKGRSLIYCSECNTKCEKEEKLENERKEKKEKHEGLKKALQKNCMWEYKTLSIPITETFTEANKDVGKDNDKLLNEKGEQGWELVSMCGLIAHNTMSGSPTTRKLIYVFKRKI